MIDDSTQHIARISYGKDSLKMLEVIKSRGLPLDRITTTDVWATDTISANLPPMEAFKDRMDQRIWDMYRIQVEHLCARNPDGSKKTYEQMFYHVPVRKSGVQTRNDSRIPGSLESVVSSWTQTEYPCTERKVPLLDSRQTASTTGVKSSKFHLGCGIKGWPLSNKRLQWCQKLKTRAFLPGPATRGRKRNIVEYLGITADEPARFGQLNARKRAPLVEFGIDEELCGLYCQYSDMLAPTYETSCRDGCWFCHNQGIDQLRLLRRNYPDLWALLMKWDLDSPVTFHADGHTVHDFDLRFQYEDEGWIDTHRPFRWSMIERKPAFRCYNFEEISLF